MMNETNPLIALVAYSLAIVSAALLLRAVPKIARHLQHSGESRYASIDGLRGYLAFGVFVHHSIITWIFCAPVCSSFRRATSTQCSARAAWPCSS